MKSVYFNKSVCCVRGKLHDTTAILILCFIFVLRIQLYSQISSSPLTFINSTLISGTAGNVNAVYKFQSVTDGVDAHVTLSDKYNGASIGSEDIPASTTGYDPAFQPTISIASGSSGSPKTSYVEWQIRFKKAGTSDDTSLAFISATAIDVDGNSTRQEIVQAYTPSSYSVNSPNELTVSTDGVSVTALGSMTDYSGMDSAVKAVMFQMNFQNVNLITYRTGGVNKGSSNTRQFSIYFKAFFTESSPLPVDLLYFTAEIKDNSSVSLNWATATEINNSYFSVERSDDAENYHELGSLPGAGNSSSTRNYGYTDKHPNHGTNYYRLIQIDHDGNQKIYDPVVVNFNSKVSDLTIDNVYPNPFRASAKISISSPSDDLMHISILNAQGVEKKSVVTQSINGESTWNVSGLQDLESGVYFLQASQNGVLSKTFRLMKN